MTDPRGFPPQAPKKFPAEGSFIDELIRSLLSSSSPFQPTPTQTPSPFQGPTPAPSQAQIPGPSPTGPPPQPPQPMTGGGFTDLLAQAQAPPSQPMAGGGSTDLLAQDQAPEEEKTYLPMEDLENRPDWKMWQGPGGPLDVDTVVGPDRTTYYRVVRADSPGITQEDTLAQAGPMGPPSPFSPPEEESGGIFTPERVGILKDTMRRVFTGKPEMARSDLAPLTSPSEMWPPGGPRSVSERFGPASVAPPGPAIPEAQARGGVQEAQRITLEPISENTQTSAPFALSDERMAQTMPSGGAPGGEVYSPFLPEDQRAVLEQAFGSPGRSTISPQPPQQATRSPFDMMRDEEAYLSPESLERRLKDEKRHWINDSLLAMGAGILGGDDLMSGLGAGFEAIRAPRADYQEKEQGLPLEYSEKRFQRGRQTLEDQRLADELGIDLDQLEILKAQEADRSEAFDTAGPVRDREARIAELGGQMDQEWKNLQSNDEQTRAESQAKINELAMRMRMLIQSTQSDINVDAAQIGALKAQAQGTGAWSSENRGGSAYDMTKPSAISAEQEISRRIEEAEAPMELISKYPMGVRLWEGGPIWAAMDPNAAAQMMPYGREAGKLRRLIESNVPIDEIMRNHPDIRGTPLEEMIAFYQEKTAAALGAGR